MKAFILISTLLLIWIAAFLVIEGMNEYAIIFILLVILLRIAKIELDIKNLKQ